MKIIKVSDNGILFDNGYTITAEHDVECCEDNFANFIELDDIALEYDFDTNLRFEKVENGFMFGDKGQMFFVPCYSVQGGWYSDEVDIFLHKEVLSGVSGCFSYDYDGIKGREDYL